MMILLSSLLVLLLSISAHALESCDVVGVLKADTTSCGNFYQCTNSGWVLLVCPTGLYFNPDNSVCDWPDQVNCVVDTDDEDTEDNEDNEETDQSTSDSCEVVGVLKADNSSCDKFYECTNSGWISVECSTGLYFNPEDSVCDWPDQVNCVVDTDDEDNEDDDQSTLDPCDSIGQLKVDSTNCSNYYSCTDKGWASKSCESLLYFDSTSLTCGNWSVSATCVKETDTDDDSGDSNDDQNSSENDDDNTDMDPCDSIGQLKVDSTNCSNYYSCTDKGWASKSCESLLYFDSTSLTCGNWSVSATCEKETDTDDNSGDSNDDQNSNEDNDDNTDLDPCDSIGQLKVDSTNCSKYYSCTDKGWASMSCESLLYFDSTSLTCGDWSVSATCEKETDTDDDSGNSDDDQNSSEDDDDSTDQDACDIIGQKKADSKNCGNYYICTGEGWTSESCKSPLLFNSKSLACDWAVYVTCEEDTNQDDESTDDDDDSDEDACGIIGQKKGDSTNCGNYYMCTDKGWTSKSCKSPLLFNSRSLTCDWAVYVTCEEDTNQDDDSGHSDDNHDHSDMESCKTIGQMKGDSRSCQRYYQCTKAGWSYRECRSPLLFNSRSLTCDYAMYVTCEKDKHVRSSDVSESESSS